ncbi:MAG: hypothetical protein JRI23_11925 [Deltaproteobacteria bacterium]|jgi:hypothetical protein|nr:hypothetical protein [Deltaproteobacteria bacterium]MBW2532416.1 hypothetical protein [Deltaproteobacteria bacterium]
MRVVACAALVVGMGASLGCEVLAGIDERTLDPSATDGLTPIPPCSPGTTDDLVDDFGDGDLNPLWRGSDIVRERDGEVRFQLSTDAQIYGDVRTFDSYDLRGCQLTLEITAAPNYAENVLANFGLSLRNAADDGLNITVGASAGQLFAIFAGGVEVSRGEGDFSLEYDRWWRIREQGGTVYFETSRNGVDWSQGHEGPSPSFIDDVEVYFWGGTIEAHPNPGEVGFDNVNLLP